MQGQPQNSALLIETILKSDEPYDYFELMNVREFLEVEIAGRLAHSAPQEELDAMSAAIDNMRRSLDRPEEYTQHDIAFHMAFYRATGNEILVNMMTQINRLLIEAMTATFATSGSAEMSLRRHEQLLDRIKAGDALGARRTMQEIITRGKGRLHQSLQEQAHTDDRSGDAL